MGRAWSSSRAEALLAGGQLLEREGIAGATVCTATTTVDLPDQDCRRLDQEASLRVAEALDGLVPYGRSPLCTKDGPVYRVVFDAPDERSRRSWCRPRADRSTSARSGTAPTTR